jgi:Na+-translocating ferredoxin:NAD+ oxidoreductase RnfD subunit
MPLWTIILCLVLSVTITQIFFGGFGYHVFHPAVTGQVFLMINFLSLYNNSSVQPFENPFFGFYSYATMSFTNETMLLALERGTEISAMKLFMGPNVGTYAATFPYLILIVGALYLYFGRVNRLTPLIYGISLLFFSSLGSLLIPNRILPMIPTILAGDALFYLFFIFSDRLTSPRTKKGRLIAGVFAGVLTILIRSFSINSEGVLFAAMFNYAFTPLYDELIFYLQRRRESI